MRPPRRRSPAVTLLVVGLVVLLFALFVGSIRGLADRVHPHTEQSPEASGPTAATQQQETQALAGLASLRTSSLGNLSLDGRWVAQLSSKAVGTQDPLQLAANGTHTFGATDIAAQVATLQKRFGSSLLLLQGTDFGRSSRAADGSPFWIVVVDQGFAGEPDVDAWCASNFADGSDAQRADACAARRLTSPHSP